MSNAKQPLETIHMTMYVVARPPYKNSSQSVRYWCTGPKRGWWSSVISNAILFNDESDAQQMAREVDGGIPVRLEIQYQAYELPINNKQ